MLIPQRPNVVPLHNRYSILSDTALSETKENSNSHHNIHTDNNDIDSNSNLTEQRQTKKRKPVKEQSTKSKQDNKPKNERSRVLILGDSIPKHVDGLKMHKSLKWKYNVTVKAFSGSTI